MTSIDARLWRKYGVPGPRYTSYPTVPFWESAPTANEWILHLDRAIGADTQGAGGALYVHIPFCHALCTFCGCNMRVARNHALVQPYLDAVLREWRLVLARLGRGRFRLGQLYLGGGTPTFLHAEELDTLLGALLEQCEPVARPSFTLEADPRGTTRAQLEVLRRHGFDQLSLGVQDFDPRVQDIVNRVQDESQVRRLVLEARELGFTSLNFDLIYGLPMQTRDSMEATLAAALRLAPERIAFYGYTHVPWIKPSQRRFTEADLPEGDARRELYERGREQLLAAGYVELGMEHFALPHDRLAMAARDGRLHRNFMGHAPAATAPLVGLGVSAIGDAGDAYAQNEKNLQQYQERVARDELPLQRGHLLTAEDRILRWHIQRLLTRYATRWDAPEDYTPWLDEVPGRLAELEADGLVRLAPRSVEVTAAGRAFLRNVCMAFDARMNRRAPALRLFSATA